MNNTLKLSDYVVCVNDVDANYKKLKVGNKYIVEEVDGDFIQVDNGVWFMANRFELVK